jgi:hypothetical protein
MNWMNGVFSLEWALERNTYEKQLSGAQLLLLRHMWKDGIGAVAKRLCLHSAPMTQPELKVQVQVQPLHGKWRKE